MMLTTAQAAALLAERGVRVKGKNGEHAPTARTVEQWCRRELLPCDHIGEGRRGFWLVSEEALDNFTPPPMGRRKGRQGK